MAYYVSACKDNGSETETCDDSEAQFWTLYVRDDAGLSQGIIDLAFREDAEAVMAVYVERDEFKALVEGQSELAGRNAARAQKAEAEIARRDAAASEAVHLYREHNPCNGMKTDWIEIDSEQLASLKESTDPETAEFRTLHDAAPPAVVSDDALREVIRAWSAAPYPGPYVYEKMRKALGAQPQKPVAEVEELSMQIRRLVHSLKNSNPDSSLLKSVPDYMQRKGYWKATDCLRGEHD